MKNEWPHRCAILLAVLSFLSVATGTAVTASQERPYYSAGQAHYWLGAAATLLTIVLALLIHKSPERSLRFCGWTGLATVTVEAALGFQPLPQPPVIRFIHALAGQVFFPLALTIAVCTSDAWIRMPKQAASNKWLSSLTRITPFVVFAQIVLRTLFRHGALGLGPHLLGAFMAIAFVMGLAFPVISRPEFDALQAAARTFLTIACIQILLGFALFTMEAMEADPEYTILVTMIHTAIATVTLAATATMAVLIRRACLSPKSETVLASFD